MTLSIKPEKISKTELINRMKDLPPKEISFLEPINQSNSGKVKPEIDRFARKGIISIVILSY